MKDIILGIDFDNTIVCYDELFYKIAIEWKCIPEKLSKKKNEIKKYLINKGQEDIWTEMQGYVYGKRMLEAKPYPGVLNAVKELNRLKIPFYIISHKTKYPYIGPKYDLHESAGNWIKNNNIFKNNSKENIFFNLTKEDKINCIRKKKCSHFIDDLIEIFKNPLFPSGIIKILFDPDNNYKKETEVSMMNSWEKVFNYL